MWAGPLLFPLFLLTASLAGAAIALFMLARRHFRPQLAAAQGPSGAGDPAEARPARATHRPMDVPYGAAIDFGGLAVAVFLLIQG